MRNNCIISTNLQKVKKKIYRYTGNKINEGIRIHLSLSVNESLPDSGEVEDSDQLMNEENEIIYHHLDNLQDYPSMVYTVCKGMRCMIMLPNNVAKMSAKRLPWFIQKRTASRKVNAGQPLCE